MQPALVQRVEVAGLVLEHLVEERQGLLKAPRGVEPERLAAGVVDAAGREPDRPRQSPSNAAGDEDPRRTRDRIGPGLSLPSNVGVSLLSPCGSRSSRPRPGLRGTARVSGRTCRFVRGCRSGGRPGGGDRAPPVAAGRSGRRPWRCRGPCVSPNRRAEAWVWASASQRNSSPSPTAGVCRQSEPPIRPRRPRTSSAPATPSGARLRGRPSRRRSGAGPRPCGRSRACRRGRAPPPCLPTATARPVAPST